VLRAACASAATAPPPDAAAAPAAGRPDTRRWTGAAIREAFLAFYEARGHVRLPSASLVPDDPTVMLTIAGMLQFKPIFLGKVGLL
jgi:alanyl-tRNA synthetase